MKSKLINSSTQAFLEEAGQTPGYSLFDRVHGYIYARWVYLYISIGKGEHPLAKKLAPVFDAVVTIWPKSDPSEGSRGTFADGYHGKVVTAETARQLVSINQDIYIEDLEQVIPYPKARAIILQNPDHIAVLDCPCRAAKENPCSPLDVCLIVGEPFASFVIEHHPDRSRWVTQQEAIAIIEAEHRRGHVSHAFFKDAMLGRFYAICNCCTCCCGALNAHRNGTPMLAASGYLCVADEDLCIGCETCEQVCQFNAISVADGCVVILAEDCMGCGICVEHCPQDALRLIRDSSKGEPLEIQMLIEKTVALPKT